MTGLTPLLEIYSFNDREQCTILLVIIVNRKLSYKAALNCHIQTIHKTAQHRYRLAES